MSEEKCVSEKGRQQRWLSMEFWAPRVFYKHKELEKEIERREGDRKFQARQKGGQVGDDRS